MKKLTKGTDKVFDGICSGFANYLDFDVSLVRLGYILLGLIFPISMILFYFVAMLIIPKY